MVLKVLAVCLGGFDGFGSMQGRLVRQLPYHFHSRYGCAAADLQPFGLVPRLILTGEETRHMVDCRGYLS